MKKWWLPLCMIVPFALGPSAVAASPVPADAPAGQRALDGVLIEDLARAIGVGPRASAGQIATWVWTCTTADGPALPLGAGDDKTLTCPVGSTRLIAGWHQGTEGMRPGEVRRITVPPHLAYGDAGSAPMIPPNATLIFEIALTDLKDAS